MVERDLYADIILPLPLPQLFTYHIPESLVNESTPGKRAVVQFGAKKIYTGIIHSIHQNKPEVYQTKDLISILDEAPIVNRLQIKLWEWIASYYMCTIGEVFKASLPAGLKLESETKVLFNPAFEKIELLTSQELILHNLLEDRNIITIQEISNVLERKSVMPLLKSMHEKGALTFNEKLQEGYKPLIVDFVRLHPDFNDEAKLNQAFDNLSRAPQQTKLLMTLLDLTSQFDEDKIEISKKILLEKADTSPSTLKALSDKGIIEIYFKEKSRLHTTDNELPVELKKLNTGQQQALAAIHEKFEKKNAVVLHGVTSSGKTEVYIHLISEMLEQGKQVLYLLPEIALTTQIINRLKDVFGDKAGIYHSKFNDGERVETWKRLMHANNSESGHYQLILGVRSSVFLPFDNLGLIIVDEEHENTYKQYDPAPRYNARDTALVLAQLHGAKTLLGTATPSVETYFNAREKKYGLVELTERYQQIKLPEIILADTRKAYRKKQMHAHFTPILLDHISDALKNNEQVILFQNRRGFAPFLSCEVCGWVPYCKHCDVSLTYHKHINQLVCHYCGYSVHIPQACSACGNPGLSTKGFGTEKIEDDVAIFFPDARIARMDLDTTRKKRAYETIISAFEDHKVDILIGTQMISKGLDFNNVSLVGILNADNMLNFPDFRAFERSYQLMAQVSGRAGRKNKQGKVIIQTGNPEHTIIRQVVDNQYTAMYNSQLEERKQFHYPPYYRMVKFTLKHKNQSVLDQAADLYSGELKNYFGNMVLGPEYPLIGRVQNFYRKNIIVKVKRTSSFSGAKKIMQQLMNNLMSRPAYKTLQVTADVDPL